MILSTLKHKKNLPYDPYFLGAITLSKTGEVGIGFTSRRMSWAYRKGNEIHYGIEKGQHEIEKVK